MCDNLIFHRRTALDKLGEGLLDANRTIGQPNKITLIFARKARMRQVVEALIASSASPNGFTACELAARARALSKQSPCQYGPCHAAYDLEKLRGKHIVRRIGHTRRCEPLPTGLRAITALLVLRNKAIKPSSPPLNLSTQPAPRNPKPIDAHYQAIRVALKAVFHELGLVARQSTIFLSPFAPKRLKAGGRLAAVTHRQGRRRSSGPLVCGDGGPQLKHVRACVTARRG